jgi:hypothetical protein
VQTPASVVAQYDGVIDLTSEDPELEVERQDLLSSFRGRASNERATKQLHAEKGKGKE